MAATDWSPLEDAVDITVFDEHIDAEDALAVRLDTFEIVFLMRERTSFPASLLARLPKLELIITSGMRNFSIDMDAAEANGVTVTGTPILPYPAAEHTWALMLALAKNVVRGDHSMRHGAWTDTLAVGFKGKTLGVIGLGKLGSQVARVGLAFGMQVLAWSQNLTRERCEEVGVSYATREELFANSDFVTIHLHVGERNRGLVTAEDFARMQPQAYLINTSRGPIVVENDLIDALKRGRIAGAGLDVYDIEPLPAEHALRSLPNTVLTPHQGYVTVENYRDFYATAIENVLAWLDGQAINVISRV